MQFCVFWFWLSETYSVCFDAAILRRSKHDDVAGNDGTIPAIPRISDVT